MKRILITSVLVATILVGAVLAYALLRPAQDYFSSGKNYYDQQKYVEAAIQFSNAVQKDAKNRDARYYLALSYINQNNLTAAFQQLKALLEYFPEDKEASIRLGNIY